MEEQGLVAIHSFNSRRWKVHGSAVSPAPSPIIFFAFLPDYCAEYYTFSNLFSSK